VGTRAIKRTRPLAQSLGGLAHGSLGTRLDTNARIWAVRCGRYTLPTDDRVARGQGHAARATSSAGQMCPSASSAQPSGPNCGWPACPSCRGGRCYLTIGSRPGADASRPTRDARRRWRLWYRSPSGRRRFAST
jgi:hypothetical protein